MLSRRNFQLCAAASLALPFAGTRAQPAWPSRPIRLIVSFPPGGPSDTATRLLADKLRAALGQPVVVENKPGAGGNIGLAEAARAEPDGYTLALIATSTFSVNPSLYTRLSFDVDRDFTPVAVFARTANILFVTPGLPARNLQEFIALARSQPGKLNGGFPGSGNSSHISLAMLRKMAGLDIAGISYPGDAQCLNALMSGEIHMLFSVSTQAAQLVDSGRVRALAVAGPVRAPVLPGVPTFEEAGVKGFFDTTAFFGIATNAAVPREIVERLNREINRAADAPEFRARLNQFNMTPGGGSPDEVIAFTRAERVRWGQAVRESGAKVE
jgi:tripartite-type tricarboxylate transporter receptor subunit TctC